MLASLAPTSSQQWGKWKSKETDIFASRWLKNLVIISIGWDLVTWGAGKWGLLLAVQLCTCPSRRGRAYSKGLWVKEIVLFSVGAFFPSTLSCFPRFWYSFSSEIFWGSSPYSSSTILNLMKPLPFASEVLEEAFDGWSYSSAQGVGNLGELLRQWLPYA